MRKLVLPIFVLGLAAVSAAWAAGGPGDAAPPPGSDKAAAAAANLPDAPKAATTTATTPATPAPATAATPAVESQLAELRALLHAQAAEIDAQRHELAEMKAKLGSVKEEAVTAAVTAAVPAATAAVSADAYTGDGGQEKKSESPLAIHYKGITLTPGGFTAAETVYRNRALSADVNTPLNNINFLYAGSNQSKISEFNASGRQSRISMKMDGKLAGVTIGGYYEGDFLGAGSSSNDNESNSFVFRQRQFWGQVRFDSGWIITGGQMWSLVTETRKLLDNRTEATPLTVDAQYTVGFSWARQYGFRVVKNLLDNKLALGFSVEGAQTRFSQSNANNNFILQAPGNAGGLFNPVTNNQNGVVSSQNFTLNATPDFVFKAALEPGGSWGHYEIFGVVRTFRSRVYPCVVASIAPAACAGPPALPATSLARNDTVTGGGGGLNARVPLFNKKLDIGVHALYGDGVGRYGTGSLSDTTVHPNGVLAPIRGGQALGTIEWHATPMLDVYLYGGGETVQRAFYTFAGTPNGFVGYGVPTVNLSGCTASPEVGPPTGATGTPVAAGTCGSKDRRLLEGTIGFWHKLWKGDRGTVQWGLQYSYVQLNAWSGNSTGLPSTATTLQLHPAANDSMFFTSFRYYLP